VAVSFDGRTVTYGFGELDTLVPAYATIIHKSQGSEYLAVVIPVLTQHYPMLQRNLLYTSVTRGKRLVVLVGQRKAVGITVRNVSGQRRWSKLSEWLKSLTLRLQIQLYEQRRLAPDLCVRRNGLESWVCAPKLHAGADLLSWTDSRRHR
jgi:exodeoxyribonuclease V alpha subunit